MEFYIHLCYLFAMYSFNYAIEPELIQSQYNHLHHAETLKFLERARLDLLEQIGHSSSSLMERDIFLVITEISVRYKRELFAGPITVECVETTVRGRDLIITQRILNAKGKVAIEAVVHSCCMSGSSRRAVSPPEDFLAAFQNLVSAAE